MNRFFYSPPKSAKRNSGPVFPEKPEESWVEIDQKTARYLGCIPLEKQHEILVPYLLSRKSEHGEPWRASCPESLKGSAIHKTSDETDSVDNLLPVLTVDGLKVETTETEGKIYARVRYENEAGDCLHAVAYIYRCSPYHAMRLVELRIGDVNRVHEALTDWEMHDLCFDIICSQALYGHPFHLVKGNEESLGRDSSGYVVRARHVLCFPAAQMPEELFMALSKDEKSLLYGIQLNAFNEESRKAWRDSTSPTMRSFLSRKEQRALKRVERNAANGDRSASLSNIPPLKASEISGEERVYTAPVPGAPPGSPASWGGMYKRPIEPTPFNLRKRLRQNAEGPFYGQDTCAVCGGQIAYGAPEGSPEAWEPDYIISPLIRPDLATNPDNFKSCHASCVRRRAEERVDFRQLKPEEKSTLARMVALRYIAIIAFFIIACTLANFLSN